MIFYLLIRQTITFGFNFFSDISTENQVFLLPFPLAQCEPFL